MRTTSFRLVLIALIAGCLGQSPCVLGQAAQPADPEPSPGHHPSSGELAPAVLSCGPAKLYLPWREAGLSAREAAAHLLNRLTYGPRPREIDRLLEIGLEAWLAAQLRGDLADLDPAGSDLGTRLAGFRTLEMSAKEMIETYPNPAQVVRQAAQAGVLSEAEVGRVQSGGGTPAEREELRTRLRSFARRQGYRRQAELRDELLGQKLYRGLYSANQLHEVLTDFWFNHFNVSLTDNESRFYIPTYEREAIRPYVLGSFRQMLGATARHPAMLLYLDNTRSVAEAGAPTVASRVEGRRQGRFGAPAPSQRRKLQVRRPQGLNENYARELLELHTLGVDGGYGQEDVVQVARAFTGWAALPAAAVGGPIGRAVERHRQRPRRGFVFDGDFIFRADVHDAGKKQVLGHTLAAGRGLADGLEVLDLLAAHPSTALHWALPTPPAPISMPRTTWRAARRGARELPMAGSIE